MQVFDAIKDSGQKLERTELRHFALADDVLEELATICVLHNEVQIFIGFNNLVKLNFMRMPHFFQYSNFSGNPVPVQCVLYFTLFQYFD